MNRYSEKAQASIEKTLKKMKSGELKSGRSGQTVTSKRQAIAIAISEARRKGLKVPKR